MLKSLYFFCEEGGWPKKNKSSNKEDVQHIEFQDEDQEEDYCPEEEDEWEIRNAKEEKTEKIEETRKDEVKLF